MAKKTAPIETEEEKKARETVEQIATTIAQLSRQVKAILGGRLREETIVILLANMTKLPKYQVEAVLKALVDMEKIYLKP